MFETRFSHVYSSRSRLSDPLAQPEGGWGRAGGCGGFSGGLGVGEWGVVVVVVNG